MGKIRRKQAMILTAYNDFDLLATLLKHYSKKFDCYVHVDKKSVIPVEFENTVHDLKNVFIYQKHKVNWGGYGHVAAVLFLLKKACRNKYAYYHILSANTFPCQPLETVLDYFNADKVYLEMYKTDGDEECRRRERHIYLTDLFPSSTKSGQEWNLRLHRIQDRIKYDRAQKYKYKGYFYCHLPRNCVEWCLQWLRFHPSYQLRLMTTAIPEEFFFQNMIAKSPFMSVVKNDCLIYSKWTYGDTGPANLGFAECEKAIRNGALFVRKIRDESVAEWLINLGDKGCLEKHAECDNTQ